MSIKTLLIAAAALAAATISSQAQVYSQNVVGYVNQPIPAGKFQIVGTQLINGSDANQTNLDVNYIFANGVVSSPFAPGVSSNSVMLYWNGASFTTYTFYTTADASTWLGDPPNTDPTGWYLPSGNTAPPLSKGGAAFIHNTWSQPITVTTVGTVFQGSNSVSTIKPGYNLICLQVPISTNVVVDANGNQLSYGLPLNMTSTSNGPGAGLNDTMLYWNGNSYTTYTYYNGTDASTWLGDSPGTDPAGFYLPSGSLVPNMPINQGFFIHHIGSAIGWTNTFTVQ